MALNMFMYLYRPNYGMLLVESVSSWIKVFVNLCFNPHQMSLFVERQHLLL